MAKEQSYLTNGDSDAALQLLHTTYSAFVDGRPVLFSIFGKDRWREFWGEPPPSGSTSGEMAVVGIRGKIWVMALLLVCRAGIEGRASKIAIKVSAWARDNQTEIYIQWYDKRHATLQTNLGDLISGQQKRRCPKDVDEAPALLEIMKSYTASHLMDNGLPAHKLEQFSTIIARPWTNLATAYGEIVALLAVDPDPDAAFVSLDEREFAASLSKIDDLLGLRVIEPGTGNTLLSAGEEIAEPDEAVLELLDLVQNRKPLTIVAGQPFHGKKSAVRKLLVQLSLGFENLALELVRRSPVRRRIDGESIHLPVRSWMASDMDYLALAQDVLAFLDEYQRKVDARAAGSGLADRPVRRTPPANMTLDRTISFIQENYQNLPAFFIFNDVDIYNVDRSRKAVRDSGITRLITALVRACPETRILITTSITEDVAGHIPISLDLPEFDVHFIPEPKLGDLRQFLSIKHRSSSVTFKPSFAKTGMRSDDLIALAALVSLLHEKSPLAEDQITTFLRAPKAERQKKRLTLYGRLFTAIKDAHLLPAIALVSASGDGLRTDSLRRLLKSWRQTLGDTIDMPEDIDSALINFMTIVGTRFLRRLPVVRFDPDEFDFDEDADKDEKSWQMDAPIAASFQRALRELHPAFALGSHRLVARLARDRAQIKKAKMSSPIGNRVSEDASRDIQAFVALLAGINYNGSEEIGVHGPPLRLSEEEIFSTDDDIFSGKRALKFAVKCLLQEDIDRDFRLTMVFDEDALRLELYQRIFLELGTVHQPVLGVLEFPNKLPRHLDSDGPFSPVEVIELMTTVALSAFHAQRYDVVEEVASLADRYVRDPARVQYANRLARIYCCLIDAAVLRGEAPVPIGMAAPSDAANPGGDAPKPIATAAPELRAGLLGALDYVRFLLSKHEFTDPSAQSNDQPVDQHATDRFRNAKGRLRLLAREAELVSMTDPDPANARTLYQAIEYKESDDAIIGEISDHDPVVLSGRVARRYIHFLLSTRNLESDDPGNLIRPQAIATVLALLDVNASRLRRFSGGDRVGVLVDHAKLKLAVGKTRPALQSAERAEELAFTGSVSSSGRIEVLAALASIRIRCATDHLAEERFREAICDVDAALAHALDCAERAEHLRYGPTTGSARLLRARAYLLKIEIQQFQDPHFQSKALKKLAETELLTARDSLDEAQDRSLDNEIRQIELKIAEL